MTSLKLRDSTPWESIYRANIDGRWIAVSILVARHFKDLVAWQRADALRLAVWTVVKRTPQMDLKFRNQWTDAARSICSNIAEGFGRRSHKDFARYLTHSCSSLREMEDQIHEAQQRGYISATEASDLSFLTLRAAIPTSRLRRWLLEHPDPPSD